MVTRAKRSHARGVVMNGTERPVGLWRIAGLGPYEWVLSHRGFLRMMGIETFLSIYTPKPRRQRRKAIPGLDQWLRRFRAEPLPHEDPF